MKFAKRMDQFGEGIFSTLLEMKKKRLSEGKPVIDLSVGAPNIPPAPHIIHALLEAAEKPENYVYAIQDLPELREAAALWYRRRYQVELDPETEIISLLGSQDGLAHIALSILDEGDLMLVPDPCYPVFADGPKIAGAELYYIDVYKRQDEILADPGDRGCCRSYFCLEVRLVQYAGDPGRPFYPEAGGLYEAVYS